MITIDTHIIIWDALRPELLSKKVLNLKLKEQIIEMGLFFVIYLCGKLRC